GLGPSAALLDGRLEKAPDADTLEAVADELADLLVERYGSAGGAPAADLAGSEGIAVNDLLIRLLERLQIPADLADEVAAMKRSLEAGLPAEAVEPTLTAIADLMARVRTSAQQEKQEIEGFLKELTGHLQKLDEAFRQRENVRQESLAHGRDLDQAVTEQVRGLESSVAQSEDLDALRRTIQQSVSTIRHHMESFRRTEEERARKAEEEAERLAQRLGEVEREADNLRDRIVTERRQAFFDPLTGIYNRLAYDQRIEQEYARWKRYGAPLTMMIWDVDRFKDVNDTYGHQAGDKVLRVIAKLMTRRVRETDFVARYGGEEFVTLLSETDLERARPVAEKLRQGIAEADFHYRGNRVPITVSCGIAEFGEGDDADSVFRRADAALYRAKEEGRNRCRVEEGGEG
ncbi:MAG TPA: GGDEF domain-containing protein, partial [Gammaproteobacteria bacterium]|nr:GGDEF domain-containing protein [Gammaproteobacteria bacterium]